MSDIDEIVGEFLVESYENLDRYDEDLLVLERDPADRDAIASIFRTIHTVKGTSGFFGFTELESLSHVAENLLGKLRDGQLEITAQIASALLVTGDTLRRMLQAIEASGGEGDIPVGDLKDLLTRLHDGEHPTADEVTDPAATAEQATADPAGAAQHPATEQTAIEQPVADGVDPYEEKPLLGELLIAAGAADEDQIVLAAHEQDLGDRRPIGQILVDAGVAPEAVQEAYDRQQRGGSIADTSIRVDVGLLDELMNLVGELVLARNQIVQLVAQEQDSVFSSASQRLNLITTELQEGVMKTRMQPIGNVWNKLPRVVRDLSLSLGKRVRLEMLGQDTELDKTIIEAIKDPLTHLVRNAVDHGIETEEERIAAGKPVEGLLLLRAYHEGGQVNIEITDDGAGIDVVRLKNRAIAKGVITAEHAARMRDREALNLVFAPGFSTATMVTNVSGRGVGMDVVRTNIERIGGTVDIHTEVGAGTTFRVKIPLTLAIIPALIVSSGGDRYAIPQLSLIELVRLQGEMVRAGIELVHGAPVHRLRGRLLPIVDLAGELGHAVPPLTERDVLNIIVLHADGHQFGLVVDDIHDTQEIVVKPLGSHLKDATLFAGATIMGDGRVSLILDVLGIAQSARVVSETRERAALTETDAADTHAADRRTLLLVSVGDDRRAAIELSEVERLEVFAASDVEIAGGREVVQYRGTILPLVRLSDAFGGGYGQGVGGYGHGDTASGSLDVIVRSVGDGAVGVVVGRILDIVEQEIADTDGRGHGALTGSLVIQDRVTDVLDVRALVEAHGLTGADHHLGA